MNIFFPTCRLHKAAKSGSAPSPVLGLMSEALAEVSVEDLLRCIGERFDEVRKHNLELLQLVGATSPSDGDGSSLRVVAHQDQVVWQDWQIDGTGQDDTVDKNIEEIPPVAVSKPAPSSPWQQQRPDASTDSTPKKTLDLGQPQKQSGGRPKPAVAPPLTALPAPSHHLVESGMEAEMEWPDAFPTVPRESQASVGTGSAQITSASSQLEGVPEEGVPQADYAAQERRARRQFKRLTEPGRRRIFPWQAWDVMTEMEAEGEIEGPLPTMETVAEAFYRHIVVTYPSEVDKMTNMPANIPENVRRSSDDTAESACPAVYLNAAFDLEAFFELLLDDVTINIEEPDLCAALHLAKRALLAEATVNDDASAEVKPRRLRISSNRLDSISAFVIMVNAVVIGVSTDVDPKADLWQIFEVLFTVFFLAEMMYKMQVYGLKVFFTGSDWNWNNFDFVVVCIAIFDLAFTWTLELTNPGGGDEQANLSSFTIIKMARLGRLARLVRLLRFKIFEQLKMMIQGVIAGLRVLFWAVVLLFFFIYLLGVLLRKTMGDSDVHHYVVHQSFESVPRAMFTLFRCFTDGCTAYDGTPLQVHLFDYYGAYFMLAYILIFLFVTMGIFNLIMAIFIDNVMEASVRRKQEERGASANEMELALKELIAKLIRRQHVKKNLLAGTAHKVEQKVSRLLDLDLDNDSMAVRLSAIEKDLKEMNDDEVTIDHETFDSWLTEPAFLQMLDDLDIGTSNKSELFDVLDADLSGELEVPEVISGLMKLRGPSDKTDAVASLLAIRYITTQIDVLHERLNATEEMQKNTIRATQNLFDARKSSKGFFQGGGQRSNDTVEDGTGMSSRGGQHGTLAPAPPLRTSGTPLSGYASMSITSMTKLESYREMKKAKNDVEKQNNYRKAIDKTSSNDKAADRHSERNSAQSTTKPRVSRRSQCSRQLYEMS